MTLKSNEIEKELYGPDGLYGRVVKKIEEITPRKASIDLKVSTQQIWKFRKAFNENPQGTRVTTIMEYAEKLGVE